jgi:hypothetical protein
MADKKMYILRGVADTDGKDYPDENGDPIKWPVGALHRKAAEDYAGFKGYKPIVLDVSGKADQGTTGKPTEQTKEALKAFLGDPVDNPDKPDTAFYGFSGGGYNIYWILQILAKNEKIPGVPGDYPEALRRIDLVVVFGAPKTGSSSYDYPAYNNLAKKTCERSHDMEGFALDARLQKESKAIGLGEIERAGKSGEKSAGKVRHTHVRPGGVARGS